MGTCKLRIDWPEAPPKTSAHPPAHHAEEIETKLGIFLVAKARTRYSFGPAWPMASRQAIVTWHTGLIFGRALGFSADVRMFG